MAAPGIIPGYEIVDVEWKVEVEPGKEPVILKGTVQEVAAKIQEINPDFHIDIAPESEPDSPETSANPATEVVKRWTYESYFCFGRWGGARRDAIWEGMQYLHGVKGEPRLGGGWGVCGRVSCSYNSAIYWCNDAPHERVLFGFWDIALAANEIHRQCHKWDGNWGQHVTAGQYFYKEQWNVIVRGDNC